MVKFKPNFNIPTSIWQVDKQIYCALFKNLTAILGKLLHLLCYRFLIAIMTIIAIENLWCDLEFILCLCPSTYDLLHNSTVIIIFQDYQAMVAQLEHQFRLGRLSIQGLWFYCQVLFCKISETVCLLFLFLSPSVVLFFFSFMIVANDGVNASIVDSHKDGFIQ